MILSGTGLSKAGAAAAVRSATTQQQRWSLLPLYGKRPIEELLAEEGSEGEAAADGDAPTKKEKVCALSC